MRSSSGYIFVLIWAYSQVAQAYTTFEPECTNPKETVNFVASPPTRGTLDILWSSLFTIFACTWSVLHLNVPEQRDDRDPGRWGDLKWGMKAIWLKTKWMLTTVIAPEFLLLYAVSRLNNARRYHPRLKFYADADRVPWTLAHTTLANMGGFVVRGTSDRVGKDPESSLPTRSDVPRTSTPATPIQSQNNGSVPLLAVAKEWYILDSDTIIRLRYEGHIVLPCIPQAEIDEHSKGDAFTKVIAAAQIIWTVANTTTRAYRSLATSQLEICVLAFCVCALVIYAVYWSSPKDVPVPITFLQWAGPIPSTITAEFIKFADSDRIDRTSKAELGHRPFRNDFADKRKDVLSYTFIVGALFFGAPHLFAWNFTFPTPAERIMWRASSLYCSLFGLYMHFLLRDIGILLMPHFPKSLHTWLGKFIRLLGYVSLLAYVLGRLFLIVEMFRTLFFLPPSAYIATWTSSVPTFG
ncbi:hypothetical protein V502_03814 [Pseudogymnoascus sp. VKM F-4520 (FW-2644)]|nr:hypothetical protein V502_03814 [Pseudogymnoascus sp. VKM F-4520 (FW-2644)]